MFPLYKLHTTQNNYYLSNTNLCYYLPPNSFILLTYTTCINQTLRSNGNYKKLLKYVNTTNFLPLYTPFRKLIFLFFSSFVLHQSHTLDGCHAIDSSSLSIFFLHALRCLNLLHQVITLTRAKLQESSSSKQLSSRLMLLRSIV